MIWLCITDFNQKIRWNNWNKVLFWLNANIMHLTSSNNKLNHSYQSWIHSSWSTSFVFPLPTLSAGVGSFLSPSQLPRVAGIYKTLTTLNHSDFSIRKTFFFCLQSRVIAAGSLRCFIGKHTFIWPTRHVTGLVRKRGFLCESFALCVLFMMVTSLYSVRAVVSLESIISVKIGYEEFTKTQIRKVLAWIAITVS